MIDCSIKIEDLIYYTGGPVINHLQVEMLDREDY